jgi:hypothetical protein
VGADDGYFYEAFDMRHHDRGGSIPDQLRRYCEFVAEMVCEALDYEVFSYRLGNPYSFYPLLEDKEHLRSYLTWIIGNYDRSIVERDIDFMYHTLRDHFFEQYKASARLITVHATRAGVTFEFAWSQIYGR